MIIFIIIVFLVLLFFIKRKTKVLKLNNLVMVNGGVGSGKTTLCLSLAIKEHKKELFRWKIRKYLLFKNEEMPLFYSNIPVKYKYYVPLSTDDILRKKRFAFRSQVFISEASLLADSQAFKDKDLNEQITIFVKLIRHELHNGKIFWESQSISDVHFGFKKCLNNYIYIVNSIKWLPFVLVFKVREMLYSYDNEGVVNTFNEDIEDTTKTLLISKSVWKKFDTFTYSYFTDNLDYDCLLLSNQDIEKLDLKSKDIISFNKLKFLKNEKEVNKNE